MPNRQPLCHFVSSCKLVFVPDKLTPPPPSAHVVGLCGTRFFLLLGVHTARPNSEFTLSLFQALAICLHT